LNSRLATTGEGRGLRARLAEHLRCQSAFISQVLTARTEFSLEHAAATNKFLGHTEEQSRYFLLLVSLSRAGTPDLRKHYENEIEQMLKRREQIASRIKVEQGLSENDQAAYYSNWIYSAAHIALTIPEYQNIDTLAKRLGMSLARANEVVVFLERCGLARREGARILIGNARIHLARGSVLLPKHHANWRVKCLTRLENEQPEDFHYTLVASLSKADYKTLQKMLLTLVEQSEAVIRPSKEEQLVCFAIDLFEV